MRLRFAVSLFCVCLAIAGCKTLDTASNPDAEPETTAGIKQLSSPDITNTTTAPSAGQRPSVTGTQPGLLGADPNDDLSLGKKYFRTQNYGLAEKHFRRAVELNPRDLESWVGLAASYDRLRRFDLADRAYAQAIAIGGSTPSILNNQGFSYLMRGDRRRARQTLLAAQASDPQNPYIQNNLRLLDQAMVDSKGVQ